MPLSSAPRSLDHDQTVGEGQSLSPLPAPGVKPTGTPSELEIPIYNPIPQTDPVETIHLYAIYIALDPLNQYILSTLFYMTAKLTQIKSVNRPYEPIRVSGLP